MVVADEVVAVGVAGAAVAVVAEGLAVGVEGVAAGVLSPVEGVVGTVGAADPPTEVVPSLLEFNILVNEKENSTREK